MDSEVGVLQYVYWNLIYQFNYILTKRTSKFFYPEFITITLRMPVFTCLILFVGPSRHFHSVTVWFQSGSRLFGFIGAGATLGQLFGSLFATGMAWVGPCMTLLCLHLSILSLISFVSDSRVGSFRFASCFCSLVGICRAVFGRNQQGCFPASWRIVSLKVLFLMFPASFVH